MNVFCIRESKRKKYKRYDARNREMVQRRKGLRLHRPDDGSADVFVHYSEIQGGGYRSLEENQRVQFEVGQGAKGPQATGVTAV